MTVQFGRPDPEDQFPLVNGYLRVPSQYIRENPAFDLQLFIDEVRHIKPHPFTSQRVTALARGPMVYCVEDVGNPWVKDHFRTLLYNPNYPITTKEVQDPMTKEKYVAITASCKDHPSLLDIKPSAESWNLEARRAIRDSPSELHFIPFYFRANRGGRGQMRVGLRNA
jgi:uncharacterized protein